MENIGITLRSSRIQRGLTIAQVAQDTRISARFLEALENEAFDELPAPVYVRGFLRSYANYLRLDPQPLVASLPGAEDAPPPIVEAQERDLAPERSSADPFRPSPPRGLPEEVLRATAQIPRTDPFSSRRPEPETPLDPGDTGLHRGRVGGVLLERGTVYEGKGGSARMVALAGGGFALFVVAIFFAMTLRGGGDGPSDSVLAGDGLTPGSSRTQTVIVAGTVAGGASPSTTDTADASATSESATPTPEEASTEAAVEPATPTPVPTEQPTSTPTPEPPTPTPAPPTPTPTDVVPLRHGALFSECPQSGGQPDCPAPMLVICIPDTADWFVDYGQDFPKEQYGWRWEIVNTYGDAIRAGEAGCL